MNDQNEDLTHTEREAMARLPREAAPPSALEEATVRALVARGLLRRKLGRRRAVGMGLGVAAALLLFAGGYAAGARDASPVGARLPRFALLLYEGPEYRHSPAGREDERVREYSDWAAERAARGELESGEKLADEADVVIGPDGTLSAASTAPGAARLAGFFLIRAADDRSAVEIARSCPHVRYGGSIVIREIEPT